MNAICKFAQHQWLQMTAEQCRKMLKKAVQFINSKAPGHLTDGHLADGTFDRPYIFRHCSKLIKNGQK